MKTYLIIVFALFFSMQASAQHKEGHSHDEHLGTLVDSYLQIKDALVHNDFEGALKHLSSFSEEVSRNKEMNHHPEHAEMHKAHHKAMLTAVRNASEAENTEQLRASFDDITDELLKAVQNQGFDAEKLYVQFCPMPNNGKGAKWLSKNEEISNPYLGKKMAACGSTLETIN